MMKQEDWVNLTMLMQIYGVKLKKILTFSMIPPANRSNRNNNNNNTVNQQVTHEHNIDIGSDNESDTDEEDDHMAAKKRGGPR